MKTTINIMIATSFAIILSGCGATGAQFNTFVQPTKNKGLIYIYRPSYLEFSAMDYLVYDVTNNKPIGTLENNGFITYNVKPGSLTISISPNPSGGVMAAQFLLVDPNAIAMNNIMNNSNKLKNVFTINAKPNDTTCLRWSPSTLTKIPNKIVDKETCKKEIMKTKSSKK